jgi:hypothetical protein
MDKVAYRSASGNADAVPMKEQKQLSATDAWRKVIAGDVLMMGAQTGRVETIKSKYPRGNHSEKRHPRALRTQTCIPVPAKLKTIATATKKSSTRLRGCAGVIGQTQRI